MRRSELLGLAFDCVDLDNGRITVRRSVVETTYRKPVLREHGKTESSRRTIAIPAVLTEMLRKHKIKVLEAAVAWRDYQRDPLLVFPGLRGGPSAAATDRTATSSDETGQGRRTLTGARVEAYRRHLAVSRRRQYQERILASWSRVDDDHDRTLHPPDRRRRSGRRRSLREHTELSCDLSCDLGELFVTGDRP